MQHYFADVNIIDKSHAFFCPELLVPQFFFQVFDKERTKAVFSTNMLIKMLQYNAIYIYVCVIMCVCVCVCVFLEDKCIPCQQVAIFSTKLSLLFGKTHCSSQRGSIRGKLFFRHKQELF